MKNSLVLAAFIVASISLWAKGKELENQTLSTRIVGGEQSTETYPWMTALMELKWGDTEVQFCGGALIEEGWVLTAAHCLFENGLMRPEDMRLTIGRNRYNGSGGEKHTVVEFFIHEEYDRKRDYNDIALLKLTTPSNLKPVNLVLPSDAPNLTPVGQNAKVMGWGATSEDDYDVHTSLREVMVPIVSDEDCMESYGKKNILDTNICAGYEEGGKDSCQGDSGGPLVVEANGTYYQAGIVSWGEGCALPEMYGVYTEVSKYIEWIEEKTGVTFPLDTGDPDDTNDTDEVDDTDFAVDAEEISDTDGTEGATDLEDPPNTVDADNPLDKGDEENSNDTENADEEGNAEKNDIEESDDDVNSVENEEENPSIKKTRSSGCSLTIF